MNSEAALMAKILASFPRAGNAELGIGDDAAILAPSRRLAVTTDMLIEEIDFTRAIPAPFLARKSLTANLSDLAAMGATPYAFLLSLGLPEWFEPAFELFIDELANQAKRYAIELVGGDLSASRHLVISITAIGTIESSRALVRSGGVAGDRIFLSRPVGGASAGLALLSSGWTLEPTGAVIAPEGSAGSRGYAEREFAMSAIRMQVSPEPETVLGIALAAMPEVHSCIDVSDGLSTDLERLCNASHCGAMIEYERIPQFPDLGRSGALLGINSDRGALHGGEEYALLFTSTLRESELSSRLARPVYNIGRLTEAGGLVLSRNGRETLLVPAGFDHFRG